MKKTKPYAISKNIVYEAFLRVKANRGSAGIDNESIEEFESNLGIVFSVQVIKRGRFLDFGNYHMEIPSFS